MACRVVIAGGGFGGVRTALKLANQRGVSVTLISPQPYFEYHAALYRSATGRSPLEVAIPLADFFSFAANVEVVEDAVDKLDAAARVVTGISGSAFHYDKLVLALGNATAYYGIKGLEEHSYGVKTIHQALRLKRHLHEQLVEQDIERSYVVIGGGATGVELAAELVAYLGNIRRRHKVNCIFKVYLVEAGPRVLGNLPEKFSARVERRLRDLGVELVLGSPVKAETAEGIDLPDINIASHSVVWTAGVTNNPFFADNDIFKTGKLGRATVNEYLEALADVYAVGDSADTEYSGMAQTAIHNATFVADDILQVLHNRPRQPYLPKRPIYAIPVGSHWSAVAWGRARIYGPAGWLLRRLADLRLYFRFLPPTKALRTWRYGFVDEEVCLTCKR